MTINLKQWKSQCFQNSCDRNIKLQGEKIKLFILVSVVLMENGDVYTFGYGQHGQLGHGDVNSRYSLFV